MAKSIKLQDDNYIDSSGVMHERTPLNEILNNKIKLVSLLDKRLTPTSLNNTFYGTLNDKYKNYNLLFVRITTSNGGGEGTWVTLLPNQIDQSNWEHYVLSTYRCSGQIFLSNENQIGLRIREITGWAVNGVSIIVVYGLKFN